MRFPQPGDVFGRYRLDRVLGQGAMGVVFAATDTRLDRTVALKVITAPLAGNEDFLRRFHGEASVLARLDSPYVIAISDHDEVDGLPFIVTQYVDGTDLSELVAAGPLTARTALTICAQVARGLADAHRSGVIHRDIKPANVLLRDASTPDVHAYVCDFGIARSEDADGHTATGLVAGTWAYLAPERTQGAPASRASDLYALGCVLWACLTGRPPYVGSEIEMAIAHTQAPIPRLAGSTPFVAELNSVVSRLLAKRPEDRFPDADSARAALERLLPHAPESVLPAAPPQLAPPAPPPGGAPPTLVPAHPRGDGPTIRGRWPLAVAAVAVLTLLGAGTAWALWPDDSPADSGRPPPSAGVAGDLEGDGHGDLLLRQNREVTFAPLATWTLSSTGSAFEEAGRGSAYDGELHLADADADGLPDQVWTEDGDGETPALAVRVVEADGSTWTAEVPVDPGVGGASPQVTVADLTGDGRADLAIHDETTSDGRLGIQVAVGDGEGFAAPEDWYADSPPADGLLLVSAGDFDGDGRTDLLAGITSGSGDDYTIDLQVLTTDDESLTAADPVEITGDGYGYGPWLVADLDGDGTDEAVVAGRQGLGALDPTDPDAEPEQVLAPAGDVADWLRGGGTGSQLWGTSDVDGDGDDDVVRFSIMDDSSEIGVLAAEIHAAEDGRVRRTTETWGSVTCDGECQDAFVVVPPAR